MKFYALFSLRRYTGNVRFFAGLPAFSEGDGTVNSRFSYIQLSWFIAEHISIHRYVVGDHDNSKPLEKTFRNKRLKLRKSFYFFVSFFFSKHEKQKMDSILTIDDISKMLKISRPTIYRWISETRRGLKNFPLPIGNQRKAKLRWTQTAINAYLASENTQDIVPILSPAALKKAQTKAEKERNLRNEKILKKHGI